MTQNAILFIPDISGFTEFVHHTDISHSRHIVSELLELLIDTNTMGLELAEIEGDALFMYKVDNKVDVSTLEKQIEAMYLAFHTHLKQYEYQRICHCGACSSAYNLKIKFVVHYGEIEFIKVKDSKKPYGSTVIQVHRLLKNDVPIDEYAIFTEHVQPLNGENKLIAEYDFGNIAYTYNPLSHIKEKLPEVEPIPKDVPKHKLFDQTELVKIPALELYEVISNFDYRLLWTKGIDKLEYDKNKVNRVGQKHKCLVNKNEEVEQTTVTKTVNTNQLVYGESTTKVPFTKRMNNYFVLEEMENGYTKLRIEVFADFKPLGIVMKPLMKKNIKKIISENINELILLINSGFSTKK
ncbi:DUF2652 domain-containing protein [Flavivirga eckloniae]|uniref:DUF2652 domain-containing protein n=1 Tax=Flavivirga eckloniae TaxID=1803846 RepID=A0A2K9PQU0_9FLAO|nr:DUF2652 domain-containing protein [Flavivirga eckloniae]AUP79406.1 hypothetical protein C1H87_12080 [Flavivirga eckloniae]